MFRDIEILKAGVGRLAADNTIEAMLVVRNKAPPDAGLEVIQWILDGSAYRTGNAQFTQRLAIGRHNVSVRVRDATIEQTVKARVLVTAGQKQTTEPDFTVLPVR